MSSVSDDPNVAVAFGLVIGAGAATAIGASVVFFPTLVKLASRRVLASALGLSAGVMTYVSFVEIFGKSRNSFLNAGHSEDMAYIYATLCFFGGVVAMMIIDFLVKCLSGGHHHHHEHDHEHNAQGESLESVKCESEVDFVTVPHCACASDDPLHEWEEWKKRANEELQGRHFQHDEADGDDDIENLVKEVDAGMSTIAENIVHNVIEIQEEEEALNKVESLEEKQDEDMKKSREKQNPKKSCNDKTDEVEKLSQETDQEEQLQKSSVELQEEERLRHENRRLIHMGINTAVAIGLHNFPEGLATFVAALNDPRVGAVLAVAIGIHNIPEGLCVALPVYYATGNRCKAFSWACVSGISEPIAALLGWAVLANSFSDDLYAILFGIVAGMMVVISTKELLPTAHRYDPEDTVVTYSYIGGMCIMALSLVLFVV